MTVLRGPASTFYGNAAGGVIQINTLSDFEDDFVRFRAQGGSFSSSNLSATVGLKNNKTKAVFYQNLSQSDGYRDHSRYKQQVFNARIWHDFSSKSKLSFQFNYTNSPYAYDAGGINLQSVIENRRQARPQNRSFQTFESIEHIKTGLRWEKAIYKNLSFIPKQLMKLKNWLNRSFPSIVGLDHISYKLNPIDKWFEFYFSA